MKDQRDRAWKMSEKQRMWVKELKIAGKKQEQSGLL